MGCGASHHVATPSRRASDESPFAAVAPAFEIDAPASAAVARPADAARVRDPPAAPATTAAPPGLSPMRRNTAKPDELSGSWLSDKRSDNFLMLSRPGSTQGLDAAAPWRSLPTIHPLADAIPRPLEVSGAPESVSVQSHGTDGESNHLTDDVRRPLLDSSHISATCIGTHTPSASAHSFADSATWA